MSDAAQLLVHVQPRAKRTELVGWHGNAIKVRVAAPPVDGAANDALVAFLASEIGTQRSAITIIGGATGREKRVAIAGVTRAEILRRLRLA
ncbi:MAG: DUF167 domain-containing protein [Gemmatimonadota bacterium]|nr:DUF167 domain-containing protein [Gemmatimonadota bacterium]